jgi:Rad3-related DNA helicase
LTNHQNQQRHYERTSLPADTSPVLHAQLVQTATLLQRVLLTEQSSTLFVGNALAADNSFAFYRGRFGLEHDACETVSLGDEHHEQTLLCVPNDVPEPNAPQYQRHVDEALVHIAKTLDGQLVALFTSHAALRSSYTAIKPQLEARGILVLGQGIDGSPRQLWQVSHDQERVVLLGTGSFWEGTDDIPASPTCLFITRLPMPVLNDPPMAARSEQYSDQLHTMTIPMAALRLRRALNRITWRDTKRNTIVMFDRRVVSKEYGAMVLNSLPRCSQRNATISQLPEYLLDWLTGSGAWE